MKRVWARWLLLLIWVPVSIVLGIYVSILLGLLIKVWEEYIGAILLPIIGLSGAFWIAPSNKILICSGTLVIGIEIAYFVFSPSFYPENHPLAYQPTFIPFYITSSIGLSYLILLVGINQKWFVKTKRDFLEEIE